MIPPKRSGIFPSDSGMLTRSRCVQSFLYIVIGAHATELERYYFTRSRCVQIFLYIVIGGHATELERYYSRKKVIYNDFLGPATIIPV